MIGITLEEMRCCSLKLVARLAVAVLHHVGNKAELREIAVIRLLFQVEAKFREKLLQTGEVRGGYGLLAGSVIDGPACQLFAEKLLYEAFLEVINAGGCQAE